MSDLGRYHNLGQIHASEDGGDLPLLMTREEQIAYYTGYYHSLGQQGADILLWSLEPYQREAYQAGVESRD